jgi:hypothetical protein
MEKFNKLLKKLGPVQDKPDYVRDLYDESAMNADVSSITDQLSPEDVEKIHYAETTGGKNLKNPDSTASGHYQLIDSTRELAENLLKKQDLAPNHINPLKNEAMLMKALADKYQNVLKGAKSGPYEPNVENMYLMHKNGIQGGLNALKDPENAVSKARFKEVKKLLARKPKTNKKPVQPAANLMDLLKEE